MTAMRTRLAPAAVALATTLTACGGSSQTPQACIDALDAADAGFDAFAANIRVVQEALREAFAGNVDDAQRTLDTVTNPDPTEYKQAEQECRDSA